MKCNKDKIRTNCLETQFATCVRYETPLPEWSEIDKCSPNLEETTTELYEKITELEESLDNSTIDVDCLDLKGKPQNEVIKELAENICEIKETILNLEVKDGKDGRDGRDGRDGKDGAPAEPPIQYFTWTKYADDENGSGISDSPIDGRGQPKEYIGIKQNQTTWPPSNKPSDYNWVKYIGDDGIPGENGYMWIKYSMYPAGRDGSGDVQMHDDAFDEVLEEYMVYMGIAYNKEEKKESMIPEDYTWSRIKGDDGHTGYVLDLSNDNVTVPTNSEGTQAGPTALRTAVTQTRLYYGNDIQKKEEYTIELVKTPSNLDVTIDNSVIVDDYTTNFKLNSLFSGETASVKFVARSVFDRSVLSQATFSIAKARGVSSYTLLPSAQVFKVTPAVGDKPASITPSAITFKVYQNDGIAINETTAGVLKYKIDGGVESQIPVSGQITMSATTTASVITVGYYASASSNTPLDLETIPIVKDGRQGQDGETGPAGPQGPQGSQGNPGTDAPILRMIEWKQGDSAYNNSNFKDYVYHRLTDKWYKLKNGVSSKTISGLPTDSSDWELTNEVKGSLLAENANIGGWIMRNDMLFSQAGMNMTNPNNLFSNILLNGRSGVMQFGDNRMSIDHQGIILRDSSGRKRIEMAWEQATGTPILRFYKEDGSIQWEAGQAGYVILPGGGTRPPSWTSEIPSANRILSGVSKDTVPSTSSVITAIDNLIMNENGTINNLKLLTETDGAFFKPSSMPNRIKGVNAGDMEQNRNLYSGWYESNASTMLKIEDVNNGILTGLIPDGWYIDSIESGLGAPGGEIDYGSDSEGNYVYNIIIAYYEKGKSYTKYTHKIHTKLRNT